MNSVPKLFSCSYADCWTEKHFSTEFGVLTPNHTHSHTLFWGCVSRWFGRALDWQSRGQRFDPAYLHQSGALSILNKCLLWKKQVFCFMPTSLLKRAFLMRRLPKCPAQRWTAQSQCWSRYAADNPDTPPHAESGSSQSFSLTPCWRCRTYPPMK